MSVNIQFNENFSSIPSNVPITYYLYEKAILSTTRQNQMVLYVHLSSTDPFSTLHKVLSDIKNDECKELFMVGDLNIELNIPEELVRFFETVKEYGYVITEFHLPSGMVSKMRGPPSVNAQGHKAGSLKMCVKEAVIKLSSLPQVEEMSLETIQEYVTNITGNVLNFPDDLPVDHRTVSWQIDDEMYHCLNVLPTVKFENRLFDTNNSQYIGELSTALYKDQLRCYLMTLDEFGKKNDLEFVTEEEIESVMEQLDQENCVWKNILKVLDKGWNSFLQSSSPSCGFVNASEYNLNVAEKFYRLPSFILYNKELLKPYTEDDIYTMIRTLGDENTLKATTKGWENGKASSLKLFVFCWRGSSNGSTNISANELALCYESNQGFKDYMINGSSATQEQHDKEQARYLYKTLLGYQVPIGSLFLQEMVAGVTHTNKMFNFISRVVDISQNDPSFKDHAFNEIWNSCNNDNVEYDHII